MWTFEYLYRSDGLPSSIVSALSLATSGMGLTHSDIGGYTGQWSWWSWQSWRPGPLYPYWQQIIHTSSWPGKNFKAVDQRTTSWFKADMPSCNTWDRSEFITLSNVHPHRSHVNDPHIAGSGLFGLVRTKELLLRWAEYSVFSPIMRTHEVCLCCLQTICSPFKWIPLGESLLSGKWTGVVPPVLLWRGYHAPVWSAYSNLHLLEKLHKGYFHFQFASCPVSFSSKTAVKQNAVEHTPVMRPLFLVFDNDTESYSQVINFLSLWADFFWMKQMFVFDRSTSTCLVTICWWHQF